MTPWQYLNNQLLPVFARTFTVLTPFHVTFWRYLVLIVIYEAIGVLESFSMSLMLLMYGRQASESTMLWVLAGLFVFDCAFAAYDRRVDWYINTRIQFPIYRFLKLQALDRFLQMDIPWHHEHNSSAEISKVSTGIQKIWDVVTRMAWEFVPTSTQTVLSLIPICLLSPWAGLASASCFLLFFWTTICGHQAKSDLQKQISDANEEESKRGIGDVQKIETIVAWQQEARRMAEFTAIHDQILSLNIDECRIGIFKYNAWRHLLLAVARQGIRAIWIHQLLHHELDVATFVYLNILIEKLFHSFWRMGRLFDKSQEATEAIDRLMKLLGSIPTITDAFEPTTTAISSVPTIEFVDVSHAYQRGETNGRRSLKNVSFTIEPGSKVAIVGPSGAGKTTIRRLLPRLHDISDGAIFIDGIDIRQLPLTTLRKLIGYVPPGDEADVFDESLAANIAFAKPNASPEAIHEAARIADLHTFASTLPNGYQEMVGDEGVKLSSGQKGRLVFARAILSDCPILILDEAMAAVDSMTEETMQYNLQAASAGRTLVVIAHRYSTVRDAQKILVMQHGHLVQEGTHDELVGADGLYAELFRRQLTHAH